MEDIIDKLGWKKAAAILVGLSILGILFAVFSFSNTEKSIQNVGVKTGNNSTTNSGESTSNTKNNLPGTTSQSVPAENLKTYTTDFFQISYPSHYKGIPYSVSKGILSNVKLEDTVVSRKIEIVVFDSSRSLSSLQQPFEALKYTKSTVSANSLTGTMYKGYLPKVQTHEMAVLMSKGNSTIRVMTTYSGAVDTSFENEFNSIVQSLN